MATDLVTILATDGEGNEITLEGVDPSKGIMISLIDKDTKWDLTTKDNTPIVTVVPFIGGRPDDR